MDEMNCVSIIVNSCDLYEDAWYPFFKLLDIQWSDCQNKKYLITESKDFSDKEIFGVEVLKNGNVSWSDRLINALEIVKTDYVLFFLEDQFLREKVNSDWFDNALDYMKKHSEVGVIFLRHTEKQTIKIEEPFFKRSLVTNRMPITAMVGLYRREYLKDLLRSGESAWDFEGNGSERSFILPYEVLQYSKSYPSIFVYDDKIKIGYGITQQKWLPKNKELFDKYNICVDFERLGILNPEEIKPEKDSLKKSLKHKLKQLRRKFK